jgi:esterase/lipase
MTEENAPIEEVLDSEAVCGSEKRDKERQHVAEKYLHPILFEQISKHEVVRKYEKGTHLVVLVHGFLGNSEDMTMIKNEICHVSKNIHIMSSESNEEDTNKDIYEMGKNLAFEVKAMFEYDETAYTKISFVSHSLGGLIVRAAIPLLEALSYKFHSLLTLATPHLGYIHSNSSLVSAGMWALKKWNKSTSLS